MTKVVPVRGAIYKKDMTVTGANKIIKMTLISIVLINFFQNSLNIYNKSYFLSFKFVILTPKL